MKFSKSVPALRHRAFAAIAFVLSATCSQADVWDRQTINDNGPATRQELVHGSNEQHDLATRVVGDRSEIDQDWFRVAQKAYASYEVVVERSSGDICPVSLARIDGDGASVLQNSVAVGLGCTRSLRWINGPATVTRQFIRVDSAACAGSTTCAADDTYRLRKYETTYAVPRFNNAGSQVSVLIVQNTSDGRIAGTVHFWGVDGALAGSRGFVLNPRASLVLNTTTVVPGITGSITVANDGRYGSLTGKVVALDPATGFSFDTAMEARPY